ncbi:DUF6585 family protein [Actinocrispum wychmicini]|uniref:DUF6585 family protein n=1 Tax=Actinocrispum wychmicini TaxID=1213861 RepID=UPI00104A4A76|nr:DUF6585 family protein [Actinocrispum wychmicini]
MRTHLANHNALWKDSKRDAAQGRLLGCLGALLGVVPTLFAIGAFVNGRVAVGLLLVIPLAVVIGVAVSRNRQRSQQGPRPYEVVYEFEHGFACPSPDGAFAFRWDAITSIHQAVTRHFYNGAYTGTSHVYTIATGDGGKIVVSGRSLDQGRKQSEFSMATVLMDQVSERMLTAAAATVNAGKEVRFDELAIGVGGIAHATDSVPWSRVTGLTAKNGTVIIQVDGRNWWTRQVQLVPNFPVFWALSQQLSATSKNER